MRWLARKARGWNDADDGAAAVIVAIMLVVLFGMGALVLDVGNVMWERRMLQNSADAAALAAAQDLAVGESTAVAEAAARDYASGNNHRGAFVDDFSPDFGQSTVTTAARTGDTGGSGVLQSWLAGVIGHDDYFARARATAKWGDNPGSLATFPLTISTCEYDAQTTPTYPGPHPSSTAPRTKLLFHHASSNGNGGGNNNSIQCNAESGHDTDGDGKLPGGFGWLEADGDCEVVTSVVEGEEWVNRDPGANQECDDDELQSLLNTVVQIPVFNDVCRPEHDPACPSTGDNTDKYQIKTYASFYLAGYKLSGGAGQGDASSCSGPERCIVGYFTTSTTLDGDGGGPDGGVIIVKLTE